MPALLETLVAITNGPAMLLLLVLTTVALVAILDHAAPLRVVIGLFQTGGGVSERRPASSERR